MTKTTPIQLTPEQLEYNRQRDISACRFGFKMKVKQDLNMNLAGCIEDFFKDQHGITLPDARKTYDCTKSILFDYETKGEGECNELELKLDSLAKMYYAIRSNKAFYADFENENGQSKFRPMCFWYSRHRLDHVWNYRKSQIIRSRYFRYMSTAKDEQGRILTDYYLPVHLVLTLPHKGGLYNGKRFFARELIEAFRDMRKQDWWKTVIHAGEYGIEVKKSKKHGLHIHLHSFILQNPRFTINEVRDTIEAGWRAVTGNTSPYSGIHYETLYVPKKDELGKPVFDEKGKREKDYVRPGDQIGKYLSGVMECIKYHFKPGCLEREETLTLTNGRKVVEKQFDIELIQEIINNTKGLRMYSRFGGFYKEKLLNFNNLEKEVTDEVIEEVLGSADEVEERLINPWTMDNARTNDYQILYGSPNSFVHYGEDHPIPHEPFRPFCRVEILPKMDLKTAIKMMVNNTMPNFGNATWDTYT